MKIGVLGAGQLGRMLALAGYPLGMDFCFYDTSGAPSVGLADVYIDTDHVGDKLDPFLERADIVTYEFEHLPLELTQHLEQMRPLFPSTEALRICQNRALEKDLFQQLNIPTPAFRIVESADELRAALDQVGLPAVAKSTTLGYDGKGQYVLRNAADAETAWASIQHPQLIVEAFVDFEREISMIAARSSKGELAFYPITENVHEAGILRYSVAPAPQLDAGVAACARDYIQKLLEHLNYVGVLTLELFQTAEGLMANEMAPRVHNSGHWTIEGCHASQFENHLRAICGLPLGDTDIDGVAAMINIIGRHGDRAALLELPGVNLHLYGKEERAGRKLGHVTLLADNYQALFDQVEQCQTLLPDSPPFHCSLTR